MLSHYFIVLICMYSAMADSDWGYRNDYIKQDNVLPTEWHASSDKCGGAQQSPINVIFGDTTFDSTLKEINIKRSESDASNDEFWTIQNNGHTAKLSSNKKYTMDLNSEMFEFLQMHFHWRGSEHFVNGEKFAGELHLVHKSLNRTGMYAVIGFFIELVPTDNSDMKPIVNSLKEIKEYQSETTIADMKLEHILPFSITNYYRYFGSLTTPSCDEVVEWNVVDRPVIGISETQMLEFQALRDRHGYNILTNSRPIQSTNKRAVKRSFFPNSRSFQRSASGVASSANINASSSFMFICALGLFFKSF